MERQREDGIHDRRVMGHSALPQGQDPPGPLARAARSVQGWPARLRLGRRDLVRPGSALSLEGGRPFASRRPRSDARGAARLAAPRPPLPPARFGRRWEYEGGSGFHGVAVCNGPWAQLNAASLAFWESHWRRGDRSVALGGSDTHYLHGRDLGARDADSLGTPTTWVQVGDRRTVDAILAALREGRSFVSESPRGPQLYLEPDPARVGRVSVEVRDGAGAVLVLLSEAGAVETAAVSDPAWDRTFDVPAGASYVRAQLAGANGNIRALTNPLWTDRL